MFKVMFVNKQGKNRLRQDIISKYKGRNHQLNRQYYSKINYMAYYYYVKSN